MVSFCPWSLVDLCAIRVAYLMWTRQNMYNRDDLRILACRLAKDVKKLPLDINCIILIVKSLEFTGRQLIPLFTLWVSKTKIGYLERRSFKKLLYENLVLKFDGLINQRETAEKILARRILPNQFAFRLACVNFLEQEVSRLWHLEDDYLEEIILEEEPNEVLFWICYHLMQHESVPSEDFEETDEFAFDYCFKQAINTGNTSLFDFLQSFSENEYSNVALIQYIVRNRFTTNSLMDFHQTCVIFHLKLLNLEELEDVFFRCPLSLVYVYLNWPMSQTFIENAEKIWAIIPDNCKDQVFVIIFSCLFGKNEKLMFEYNFKPIPIPIGNHSFEHLIQLWNSLWQISRDSYKLKVLNDHVFKSIEIYVVRSLFLEDFNNSILKKNLVELFLSNGKAIFELYTSPNLKDSLIRLIKKHLPNEEIFFRYFKKTPINKRKRYPYPSSIFIPSLTCQVYRKNLLDLYEQILSFIEDE